MELCASRAVSDLPVSYTVLAGNPQVRPRHAFSLRMTLPSRGSSRGLDSRCRHFSVSMPRAAGSDDSSGFRPFFSEERDSVVTLEESPSAETLSYSEVETSEVPKEEPVEDAQEQTTELLEESPSAETVAYSEVDTPEVPKEEPVEDALEQTIGLLNDLKLESGDVYSIILYGTGAFLGLWLVTAIVGAIDSIPLFPKLLEVVGLGYTFWFATRFLLFKESRDELAAKIDELKGQVLGSDKD